MPGSVLTAIIRLIIICALLGFAVQWIILSHLQAPLNMLYGSSLPDISSSNYEGDSAHNYNHQPKLSRPDSLVEVSDLSSLVPCARASECLEAMKAKLALLSQYESLIQIEKIRREKDETEKIHSRSAALREEDLNARTSSDLIISAPSDPYKVQLQKVLCEQKQTALQRSQKSSMPLEYARQVFFTNHHPALTPIARRYQPKSTWAETTIADFNIVGLPKAGTSQLYQLLAKHQQVEALGLPKEWCMSSKSAEPDLFRNWEGEVNRTMSMLSLITSRGLSTTPRQQKLQEHMYNFHQQVHVHRMQQRYQYKQQQKKMNGLTSVPPLLTVNGCIWDFDIELSYWYVRPSPSKRYILLFRDPADWLWSAWNYWPQQHLDNDYQPGGWTVPGKHYRSPELFHEFIASHTQTREGRYLVQTLRIDYMQRALRLHAMLQGSAGSSNPKYDPMNRTLWMARSEDMKPSLVNQPGGFLDRLVQFTGLSRNGFSNSSYTIMRNCNEDKGERKKCEEKKEQTYAIAGGRGLLPETRTLIYLHYWEECKLLQERFGVVYPDCVNVMNSEHLSSC
jgi:hypothetical protein